MSFWVYVYGSGNIEIFNKVLRHERQPITHENKLGVGRNLIRTLLKGSSLLPTENSAKMAQQYEKGRGFPDDGTYSCEFAIGML